VSRDQPGASRRDGCSRPSCGLACHLVGTGDPPGPDAWGDTARLPCEATPVGAEMAAPASAGLPSDGTEMWETDPCDLTADSVPLRAIIIVAVGAEVIASKGAT
jgi:hypothetical protein